MPELLKSASALLALTVALGLPMRSLEAAEEQAKPAGDQVKATETHAMAEAPQPDTEETVGASEETPPSNGIKTFDALAVRPVTFVSSVFSAGAFVLALPFAALDPAMSVEETRRNLVEEPFKDTFQRPLGDFNGSAW